MDTCAICPRRNPNARNIHGARIQYALPTGPVPAPIMFVGDVPDGAANQRGRCMSGKLGREFDECYLPAAGLHPGEVYVTNAMKCQRPDTDTPTPDEARVCSQFWLRRELDQVRPKVVVAMGGVAAKALVSKQDAVRVDLDTYHGQLYGTVLYERDGRLDPHTGAPGWWWKVEQPDVLGYRGLPLVIVTHPNAGFAGSNIMLDALGDFRGLREGEFGRPGLLECIDRGQYPHLIDPYPFPFYRELTTAAEVLEALRGARSVTKGRWVAADTETDGETAWCLSFSTAPGTGYVIPAECKEALAAFRWYVTSDPWIKVLLHNATFDLGIMAQMGVEGFKWRDTMHTAYQRGDQPQGLKPLAWRLCGMEMVDYSEVVRMPSVPKVLEWAERVGKGTAAAIPVKVVGKSLKLEPYHKEWKKQARLLRNQVDKTRSWYLSQLFPQDVGGDFPDPWKWWGDRTAVAQNTLSLFGPGPMPLESIVHVPRARAIDYAARDADATLRASFALRKLIRLIARTVPPGGERPRIGVW